MIEADHPDPSRRICSWSTTERRWVANTRREEKLRSSCKLRALGLRSRFPQFLV
jgi:hypothetical protein